MPRQAMRNRPPVEDVIKSPATARHHPPNVHATPTSRIGYSSFARAARKRKADIAITAVPESMLRTPPPTPAVPKMINPSKNHRTAHPDVLVVPIASSFSNLTP